MVRTLRQRNKQAWGPQIWFGRLGVWSRDEVTRISLEYSWGFLPGVNNGLISQFPSGRLEVFGKVEGANGSVHMGFQAL